MKMNKVKLQLTGISILLFAITLAIVQVHFRLVFYQADYLFHYDYLSAATYKDFFEGLIGQMQPYIPYVLHKSFFSPLLGFSERNLRIPSILWSCLIPVLFFLLSYYHLLKNSLTHYRALVVSLLLGFSLCVNPFLYDIAWDSRHYTFVAWLSMFWFYFALTDKWTPKQRILLTYIFANSHFFSLIPIGMYYGYGFLTKLNKQSYKTALKISSELILIVAFTVYMNSKAILASGAGAGHLGLPNAEQLARSWEFFSRWIGFYPLMVIGAGVCVSQKNLKNLNLKSLFLFIAAPIFFVYYALKSTYFFSNRYFCAFWGFLPVMTLLLVDDIRKLNINKRIKWPYAVIGIAYLIFVLPSTRHFFGATTFAKLSPNFSKVYNAYRDIKDSGKPLVVFDNCNSVQRPLYYLQFGARYPYGGGYVVYDFCNFENDRVYSTVNDFMKKHPGFVLVLDQATPSCEDLVKMRNPQLAPKTGKIQVHQATPYCITTFEGITNWQEVRQALDYVKFENRDHFYNTILNRVMANNAAKSK